MGAPKVGRPLFPILKRKRRRKAVPMPTPKMHGRTLKRPRPKGTTFHADWTLGQGVTVKLEVYLQVLVTVEVRSSKQKRTPLLDICKVSAPQTKNHVTEDGTQTAQGTSSGLRRTFSTLKSRARRKRDDEIDPPKTEHEITQGVSTGHRRTFFHLDIMNEKEARCRSPSPPSQWKGTKRRKRDAEVHYPLPSGRVLTCTPRRRPAANMVRTRKEPTPSRKGRSLEECEQPQPRD